MEKLLVLFLLLFAVGSHFASFPYTELFHLRIDCGVKGDTTEEFHNETWFPDSFFTNSGKIKRFTLESNDIPPYLNTLRQFSDGDNATHCYPLPLVNTHKFLFRAGFYYNNYDHKEQPPTFDLELGGQHWTTVAPPYDPLYKEVIYEPRNENITVCLRAKAGGGNPFISSLEATVLDEVSYNTEQQMYGTMKSGTIYSLVSRLNFGGYNLVVEPWSMWESPCEESQNRYWMPRQMLGYTNVTFEHSNEHACTGKMYENCPPDSVINTAITPLLSSSYQTLFVPIKVPFASNDAPQIVYMVLYFHQSLNSSLVKNPLRIMNVYVDDDFKGSIKFEDYFSGQVMTLYPVTVRRDVMELTVSPGKGTALPPLLNGMEVFTATEMGEEIFSFGVRVLFSWVLIAVFQVFVSGFLVLE